MKYLDAKRLRPWSLREGIEQHVGAVHHGGNTYDRTSDLEARVERLAAMLGVIVEVVERTGKLTSSDLEELVYWDFQVVTE